MKTTVIEPLNWGLLGHEWAVHLLRHHIAEQTVRHAYLITGPDGVGRRTLALRFAQALNCPNPVSLGEPCRICRTCMQIEAMQYPDLSIVQAEQVGGTLKVDQIRELSRSLSLTPYAGRYRVALLLRFEEANPNAANALLKTLEEPPPQVVLLLTSINAEQLMPTVVSRCEVLRLRAVSTESVLQGLQSGWDIPSEKAHLLSQLCDGRPGYAIRLQREPQLHTRRYAWLDDQRRLLSASRIERFNYVDKLARDRGKAREALAVWQSFWRDVMLHAGGTDREPTNLDWKEELENLAVRFGVNIAKDLVQRLQFSIDLIDRNVNNRLVLEIFMLDLPTI
jgi:DNA polymerase III subunit delta'